MELKGRLNGQSGEYELKLWGGTNEIIGRLNKNGGRLGTRLGDDAEMSDKWQDCMCR